ncbi:MAG: nucleoside-diphosphate sugar epimerase/dehydratase [bacterium]
MTYLLLCGGLAGVSLTLAFHIFFDMSTLVQEPGSWGMWWLRSLPLVIFFRLLAVILCGVHRATWRYASARDAVPVLAAVFGSSLALWPALDLLWQGQFPLNVLVIDSLLSLFFLAGVRYSYRLWDEVRNSLGAKRRRKVLVIGAGQAGDLTVRAMLTHLGDDLWPVAILDDDPFKQGTTIQGVPVVGAVGLVADVARRSGATAIVLALPSATSSQLYRIIKLCRRTSLPLKTIPDLRQIIRSSNVVTRITDFHVEDLLRRRPVSSEVPQIESFLRQRVVLVTGAAGSIGSELCRQIAEQDVALLVCLDKDETGLFRLEHELLSGKGTVRAKLEFFLGDIKNHQRMEQLFLSYQPDVVFHAAAYKHVPILQHHPVEAVSNNVGGTQLLAEMADRHGVDTFLLISTDKAVNPTSVMGATKRICERVVLAHNRRSATAFSTIRFGNVLGSNGSVVELFLRQIREGRPVTVTHPDIERYFMTIPEAVHLVLYAATMGQGGEVFILDMGKPVKIDQLARQIIQLSGLTPDVDVPIEYTGLRPGEKLYEELWTEGERPRPTAHPGIRVAPRDATDQISVPGRVEILLNAADANELSGCWEGILDLVPTFQGRTNGAAAVPPDQAATVTA